MERDKINKTHDKDNKKSSTTSLLQKLTRRSTKVEPQNIDDDNNQQESTLRTNTTQQTNESPIISNKINNHTKKNVNTINYFTSTSANSSPINQFRHNTSNLRRHSSTQSIITPNQKQLQHQQSLITTTTTSPTEFRVLKKSSINRFSHQFSLCCSVEEKISTPPVSVRYNSLAHIIDTKKSISSPSTSPPPLRPQILFQKNDINNFDDRIITVAATVHKSPTSPTHDSIKNSKFTNDQQQQEASSSLRAISPPSTINFDEIIKKNASPPSSPSENEKDKPIKDTLLKPPVFNEYQSSIAMSACRSRLRQKLLPPGMDVSVAFPIGGVGGGGGVNGVGNGEQQHFSSPNISHTCRKIDGGGGDDGDGGGDDDDTDINSGGAGAGSSSDYIEPPKLATNLKKKNITNEKNRSLSYDVLTGVKRPGSTDSLAKQSLIAAQLLNLIPAERAREKNFLAGRLAVNSLFGIAELDKVLPTRELKIYVGTWNMNGQNPPKLMNDFVLPHSIDYVPDLIVVGTQESCSVRFEWEVSLQETLGPSHILLHSANLGTLHLAVFIRRDLIWFCSVPEDDSLSVRPGTAFRTKGAVAISFCLFGTTMLFVTSHLTAHQQKVKERVQDVKRIIHSLDLPRNLNIRNKNKDVTQNFDNVFWCGDLNFRLGEPREKVLQWIEKTKFPLPSHLPNGYLHTDQLKSVLSNGAAFKDFKEANITFPPTYKYDPGTQHFDTSSKQRAPAYTDRILFKCKSLPTGVRRGSTLANLLHPTHLECLTYDSVPSIVTSDHKPVWALFRCPIRPGMDSVPLAAGLFNREVYLEGMKRRLNNTEVDSSAICTIQ